VEEAAQDIQIPTQKPIPKTLENKVRDRQKDPALTNYYNNILKDKFTFLESYDEFDKVYKYEAKRCVNNIDSSNHIIETVDLIAHWNPNAKLVNKKGFSVVTGVTEGGPAMKALVKKHDIILSIDGIICYNTTDFDELMSIKVPGDQLVLDIITQNSYDPNDMMIKTLGDVETRILTIARSEDVYGKQNNWGKNYTDAELNKSVIGIGNSYDGVDYLDKSIPVKQEFWLRYTVYKEDLDLANYRALTISVDGTMLELKSAKVQFNIDYMDDYDNEQGSWKISYPQILSLLKANDVRIKLPLYDDKSLVKKIQPEVLKHWSALINKHDDKWTVR
jgi:hypothetical protein